VEFEVEPTPEKRELQEQKKKTDRSLIPFKGMPLFKLERDSHR
jgi:hypothetical protein